MRTKSSTRRNERERKRKKENEKNKERERGRERVKEGGKDARLLGKVVLLFFPPSKYLNWRSSLDDIKTEMFRCEAVQRVTLITLLFH